MWRPLLSSHLYQKVTFLLPCHRKVHMNETFFKMTTFSCPKCDFVPVTYVLIEHLQHDGQYLDSPTQYKIQRQTLVLLFLQIPWPWLISCFHIYFSRIVYILKNNFSLYYNGHFLALLRTSVRGVSVRFVLYESLPFIIAVIMALHSWK